MGVSAMRERLTIQQQVLTPDGQGGFANTWTTLDTIWAEMLPIRVTEKLANATIGAHVDYKFRVRARHDITAKMRATWRPSWTPSGATVHTLELHGVMPDEKEPTAYLVLDCGEVV